MSLCKMSDPLWMAHPAMSKRGPVWGRGVPAYCWSQRSLAQLKSSLARGTPEMSLFITPWRGCHLCWEQGCPGTRCLVWSGHSGHCGPGRQSPEVERSPCGQHGGPWSGAGAGVTGAIVTTPRPAAGLSCLPGLSHRQHRHDALGIAHASASRTDQLRSRGGGGRKGK